MSTQVKNLSFLGACLVFGASCLYQAWGPAGWAHDFLGPLGPAWASWSPSGVGLGAALPHRPLVIGIASRYHHHERRQRIRRTWQRLARGLGSELELFFFFPERPCPLDPYWRLRASACVPWHAFAPVSLSDMAPVRPSRVQPSQVRPGPPYDGLGFHLKFPIAVTQLGVSERALRQWVGATDRPLTLELLEPVQSDVIVRVAFDRAQWRAGQADDGYIYALIPEELFPRHFEGLLRISRPEQGWSAGGPNRSLACNLIWNKMFGDDGIVHLTSLWTGATSVPFDPESCPLVTFVYRIPDWVELKQVVNSHATQNQCQANKNDNMLAQIVEEHEDHGDILFVSDLTDTRDNVPLAFLHFVQAMVTRFSFDFLLVVPDDSFVAIDRLWPKLHPDFRLSWRSRFRQGQPVLRYGPQFESNYLATQYPLMPAEAGSVLSYDLAVYLNRNADLLVPFRDISSSLAVWLAPISPFVIDDMEFTDENATCTADLVVQGPFRDQASMMAVWAAYSKCGQLCPCP